MLYSPTVFGISLTMVLISSLLLLLFLCRWLQNFTKYSLFVNVYINFIEIRRTKNEIYFPTRWQKNAINFPDIGTHSLFDTFFLPLFLEPPRFIGSIKYGVVRTIAEAVIRGGVLDIIYYNLQLTTKQLQITTTTATNCIQLVFRQNLMLFWNWFNVNGWWLNPWKWANIESVKN